MHPDLTLSYRLLNLYVLLFDLVLKQPWVSEDVLRVSLFLVQLVDRLAYSGNQLLFVVSYCYFVT